MGKQLKRTSKTREKIEHAFMKLYKAKSISQMTIKEITDLAGIYRSTFYLYFDDIYDVKDRVQDELVDMWFEARQEAYDTGSIDGFMRYMEDFYDKHVEAYAAFVGDSGDPEFVRRIKKVNKDILIKALNVDPHDKDAYLFIEYNASAVLSVLAFGSEHRDIYSPHDIVNFVVEMLLKGAFGGLNEYRHSQEGRNPGDEELDESIQAIMDIRAESEKNEHK